MIIARKKDLGSLKGIRSGRLFVAEMWNKVPHIDMYILLDIVKTVNTIESIQVFFTDYQEMWSKLFTELEFLDNMKSCNAILEMDEQELIRKGLSLLSMPEDLKKASMENLEDEIKISVMKSFGFPVNLTVHAKKSSKELFYQKVTYPLLLTVQDLKASQNELCTLLVKKDKEIKEYKEEGGHIALRHLKTPEFDEAKHISSHSQFSKHFAFTELPEFITQRAKGVVIKEEKPEGKPILPPVTVKYEPSHPQTSQSIKVETERHADIKQEIVSQSSQVTRKRPRKLNNL